MQFSFFSSWEKNILLEKYFLTRFRTWEPFLPLCVFFSPGEQKHEYPFLYSILQKMSCAGKKIPEMFISTWAFLFFSSDQKRKKNHDEMIFTCVELSESVLAGQKKNS